MLDVVAPESHQNDHSNVRELSRPSFNSLHNNLAWWEVTQRTSKTTRLSKLGGGHLLGDGHLPGTIRYIPFSASCSV